MRTLIFLVIGLVGGCAAWLGQPAHHSCPAAIPAPVLDVGDTWNYQDASGRAVSLHYIRRIDGLLEREERPNGVRLFYDNTHTLRRVLQNAVWIEKATADFPDIGRPELVFPLQVGRTWADQFRAKESTTGQLLLYHRRFQVTGCAEVTVPAGSFFTVLIQETQSVDAWSGTRTIWYAPAVKNVIKVAHHPSEFWRNSPDYSLTSCQLVPETPPETLNATAPRTLP